MKCCATRYVDLQSVKIASEDGELLYYSVVERKHICKWAEYGLSLSC